MDDFERRLRFAMIGLDPERVEEKSREILRDELRCAIMRESRAYVSVDVTEYAAAVACASVSTLPSDVVLALVGFEKGSLDNERS